MARFLRKPALRNLYRAAIGDGAPLSGTPIRLQDRRNPIAMPHSLLDPAVLGVHCERFGPDCSRQILQKRTEFILSGAHFTR